MLLLINPYLLLKGFRERFIYNLQSNEEIELKQMINIIQLC
jgi:hypothetical protein